MTHDPSPCVAAGMDRHLLSTVGTDPAQASDYHLLQAVAQVAREQLSQRWVATQKHEREHKCRRVDYLSMEFLIGRTLGNALAALHLHEDAVRAAQAHARTLEDIAAQEPDAGLGNGGLGRQVEHPDPWLSDGTPWEFPRADASFPVRFGGWVEDNAAGQPVWRHASEVGAKACDMVVPGHATPHVCTLRPWKAVAPAHIGRPH